jgi:hypothetical protein
MPFYKELHPRIYSLIREKYNWYCVYCFKKCRVYNKITNPNFITLDHKTPTSKGGTDEISNLVVACRRCNIIKNNKTYPEFKRLMKQSIYQQGYKLKLRRKAVQLYRKGLTTREIGLIIGKSHQWVSKVIRVELPEAFQKVESKSTKQQTI